MSKRVLSQLFSLMQNALLELYLTRSKIALAIFSPIAKAIGLQIALC